MNIFILWKHVSQIFTIHNFLVNILCTWFYTPKHSCEIWFTNIKMKEHFWTWLHRILFRDLNFFYKKRLVPFFLEFYFENVLTLFHKIKCPVDFFWTFHCEPFEFTQNFVRETFFTPFHKKRFVNFFSEIFLKMFFWHFHLISHTE